MKRAIIFSILFSAAWVRAESSADPVGAAVERYFAGLFSQLEAVAAQQPTVETFRDAMAPCAKTVDGFFDGTLIDTHFVIRQTCLKRNALARGFCLRDIEPLKPFWEQMEKSPAPQLSEPGHGTILQPRLISMRYPFFNNGKLAGIVSMMVRTDCFLEATGLDACRAYQIICCGKPAEEKGILSAGPREIKLNLPSTEWIIRYDP